jgi:hypothetical protein
MSLHRRAARRDKNESAVVAALRKSGCLVEPLSGEGVPDLLVWSPALSRIVLIEVKDGAKSPSQRRLTEQQQKFHAEWQAAGAHVVKADSVTEALTAVGIKVHDTEGAA